MAGPGGADEGDRCRPRWWWSRCLAAICGRAKPAPRRSFVPMQVQMDGAWLGGDDLQNSCRGAPARRLKHRCLPSQSGSQPSRCRHLAWTASFDRGFRERNRLGACTWVLARWSATHRNGLWMLGSLPLFCSHTQSFPTQARLRAPRLPPRQRRLERTDQSSVHRLVLGSCVLSRVPARARAISTLGAHFLFRDFHSFFYFFC